MIKPIFCAASAIVVSAGAAVAGPYANVEANTGWVGADNMGTTTEAHLGYEGSHGAYSWYGQLGPAIVAPNGGDKDVQLSGKVGGAVQASEKFSVYAELSGMTGDAANVYGGKLGAKYLF
jgi:hypothetical protein